MVGVKYNECLRCRACNSPIIDILFSDQGDLCVKCYLGTLNVFDTEMTNISDEALEALAKARGWIYDRDKV